MSAAVRESVERAAAGGLVEGICQHRGGARAAVLRQVMPESVQCGVRHHLFVVGSLAHICVDIADSRKRLQ